MSEIELAVWQRLSPLALFDLFIRSLLKFVRENLYLFVGAGAGLAFLDWLGLRELLLGLIGLLALIVVGAVMYWRRFTFRLEADAVRVRSGVFEKKDLRVRFARVQNIQIGQPFYFRPFGVVRFSLETPGSGDKEVELPGIERSLAAWMRDRIADVQSETPGDGADTPDLTGDEPARSAEHASPEEGDEPVWRAGHGALFRHGLASNQVWVLAGILGYLSSQFFGRMEGWLEDLGVDAWLAGLLETGWAFIVALVVVLAVLIFVLSGMIALVRFHRYELHDRGDRLVAIGGLLDRREQTLRREKITGLSLKQSAIGRLLGIWYLVARQTRASDEELDGGRKSFIVPGLGPARDELCRVVLPGTQPPEELARISFHYRRFFWTRGAAFFVLLAAVLFALPAAASWNAWLVLGCLPLWLLLIQLTYRHWGWREEEGVVWVQHGLFGRQLDCFALELVQQAWFRQSPYQRRHQLASVQLILPQGSVSIPWMPAGQAAELVNLAMARAEVAPMHRV
ncbi:PH domain-containing protein [Wenzhouxiangella sp. AB-CW3]|uniref:PH domain-containing protein n=1 Tax=Wenzhouxiangella sp. AB-CW3 TaxID=2771012 RepID=UPI00168C0CF9|nr:PH domain-containing protein [Wenzhouxiangella sp. AB-CW3]QOC21325.1 PH domain-containing protein [Wenzhouxiangella sp. AB-CW3]